MSSDTTASSRLEQQLDKFKAVITESHLVLTSGKHSDGYVNLRVLAGHADVLYEIGLGIAEAISGHECYENINNSSSMIAAERLVIIGPETLGRTLAEFTAIAGSFEYFAWCNMEKDAEGNDFAVWNPKLNFSEIVNGSRCYIVDDLLTTAKSVKLVKQLVEDTGGKVEGVVVVVKRSEEVTAEVIGVPWLYSLLDISGFNVYDKDSCSLCSANIPMRLRPGHGHEWIKNHKDYPVVE